MRRRSLRTREFVKSTAGSVAAIVAVSLPVVVGVMGLGIDVGHWYFARRSLQTVADAAALAAAMRYANGGDDLDVVALADAQRNGFIGGAPALTLNPPPATGPNTGDIKAVEVTVEEPAKLYFASYFINRFEVRARAVAAAATPGEFCVVGLEPSESKAVELSGGANATLGCGVAVNSRSASALYLSGNSSLDATPISMSGDYQAGSNTALTSQPETGAPPVQDPYEDLTSPTPTACDHASSTTVNGGTLSPGVFCNGLALKNAVHLNPGVYIIDGGGLSMNAGAVVTGTDVTIILTDTALSGSGSGTVDINGGASVTLAAPSTGPWAGVLFFQDRNAPSAVNKFNGGANLQLTGALYFPSQELQFTGGSEVGGAVCTHLVARKVNFGGNAVVKNNCATTGVRNLGRLKPVLVE